MKTNYKKYGLWSAVVVAATVILARLLLSPLTVNGINDWFAEQGIESQIEDLEFDIYNGEVSLTGLTAVKSENRTLGLDHLRIDWSWAALFERKLVLNSISISGLALEAERKPDGHLVFAAIDLARESQAESRKQEKSGSEAPQWSIALGKLAIENFEVCYRDPPSHDYCKSFESLEWEGAMDFDLSRMASTAMPLQAQGAFTLSNLNFQNNLLGRRMFGFENLALRGVIIDDLDSIEIASLGLDKLAMLEKKDDPDESEITRVEKLQIEQLRLEQMNRLEVASATVLNQQGRLIRKDDDQLEIREWLQQYETGAATSKDGRAGDKAPFTFAVDKLEYRTDHSLQYVDLSLSNTFVIDLNHIKLVIENLDSASTEQPSRIDYQATYARHGKISLSGTATPLDTTPTLDLAGSIEGIDLPEFSAFTADAIGYRIKSGQLDAKIELKAVDSVLDSKVDLKLDHLKLVKLSEKDREKVDKKLGFPLDTSLALLKDRNEVIELSIPITGDINNPGFDPTDAISQATSTAITAAVLNYYTPFGLVTVVDGLFSLATALRFDPVAFEAGSSDIGDVDNNGLEKIAMLMQERPGVSVTLCAYTNSEDRKLILPDTAEIPIEDLELNKDQIALLEKLGETRRDQVEDYLVSKDIDPARLITCDTEHRESTGFSGVEISI